MWSAKRLRDDRRNNSTYAARVQTTEKRVENGDGLDILLFDLVEEHIYIYKYMKYEYIYI